MCYFFAKKQKRDFWESNETDLWNNKKIWGVIKLSLSNKVASNEKTILVEDDNIVQGRI